MPEEYDEEGSSDFIFDQINGGRGKKPVMSLLNKSKVNKHELDDLFCQE